MVTTVKLFEVNEEKMKEIEKEIPEKIKLFRMFTAVSFCPQQFHSVQSRFVIFVVFTAFHSVPQPFHMFTAVAYCSQQFMFTAFCIVYSSFICSQQLCSQHFVVLQPPENTVDYATWYSLMAHD
ncbi:hypothetical protein DPMN_021021 [Dreissena polymorpha]|uniref:Uncharacterized protein n=1 Tax=Dreissena polymorpha TaxID=45954 RepID=A0A9D4NNH9_DREPO|nr:hypothetical protein DPMN_021021 [Dreissena polymorpha]